MILLVVFAFLAGVVTVLSPCILPILPIILSSTIGGQETGKARPFGVVIGFVLSFTFFTLFLSSIVSISGIPADSLRVFSVFVIGIFGISYLIPQFQALLERLFSKMASHMPQGNTNTGFWAGLLIGLSIGLLWTPCVGPILASVISLAITGTVSYAAFIITLSYSLGTAIPMFIIMWGGQSLLRKVPWLLNNTGNIQKVFGIVMILTAVAIYNNYDRKFQTFVLEIFPQYGTGLTKFEENETVKNELDKIRNNNGDDALDIKKEDMGKPTYDLQGKGPIAPEIIPGGEWFNTEPLTLKELRGKVVIVDFWTYSCINCQRTLPYLKTWWDKYKDKGLVIIGVHAPEFEFEKNPENLRKAINDFALKYPIVQDNNFATWRAYDNHYWPAKYIIDKDGYIRYSHFGEGAYDETEEIIQELLKEAGETGLPIDINNPTYKINSNTPETYLGYNRIDGLESSTGIQRDIIANYSAPSKLGNNKVAFEGNWRITREYAQPETGSSLYLNFDAKNVYLVMRPKQDSDDARVKVFIDEKVGYPGEDNIDGEVTVDRDRLYKLIKLPEEGRHILKLEFEDSNVELFAFTFG